MAQELRISRIWPEALRESRVGDEFKLWTKPDLDFINGYARGSVGGTGIAFRMSKAENPSIAALIEAGNTVRVVLSAIDGSVYQLDAKVESLALKTRSTEVQSDWRAAWLTFFRRAWNSHKPGRRG